MTTKTLKEVFDERIDAYRMIRPGETGYYLIRFDTEWGGEDEPGAVDTLVTVWSSDFDDNPSKIPKSEWGSLPTNGWRHCDGCTCDEYEAEQSA